MEDNVLLAFFVVLLVVGVGSFFAAFNNEASVDVDFSEVNERIDALGIGIDLNSEKLDALNVDPEVSNETVVGEYMLSKSEFEDAAVEAETLRLATESVMSRDFKKAFWNVLNLYYNETTEYNGCIENENVSCAVESYKDITEVAVRDVDVDEDEAEFSVKVYFYIDDDDEEKYKANLIDFTVKVDDVDFDDDFEDAEVDEDYMDSLVLKRVYEA